MSFDADNSGDDAGAQGGSALDLTGGAGGDGGKVAGSGGQNDGDAGDAGGGDGDQGGDPAFLALLSAEGGDADNPSNRDWMKAKGFKDVDSVVKSYREAERALRDSGRVKVPGEDAKPEELAAFRTAIGVPEKPDGYEIKGPEGVQLNTDLLGKLSESALKHGAPKAAFEGLVADFVQLQLDEAAAETQAQDSKAQAQIKAWGGESTAKLAHVDKAARALDLSRSDMQGLRSGLGADRALTLLAKLGEGMAEDTLINGGKGRFGVTGAEAKAELDKLKADPEFIKKASVAGSAEAMRWQRLNAAAAEWAAGQQKAL